MKFKDYYKNLGLEKNASQGEIKNAYRKLARKYHPDLNPGNKKAEERFKEINEAYDVLQNKEKRKKYDQLGPNWEEILRNQGSGRDFSDFGGFSGFGPQTEGSKGGFSDFFEAFFGASSPRAGGFGAEKPRPQKGQDTQYDIQLTLEGLIEGGKRSIRISVEESCSTCKGLGQTSHTTISQGRRQTSNRLCPNCQGSGQVNKMQTIEVKIPKGIKEGSKIRLFGLGNRGSHGAKKGDLYLKVHLTPHRIFKVEGHDLLADLPVWDDEAALGAEISVPTLTGNVRLQVPPGTQTGHSLRLKGKGLPKVKGTGAGDLYWNIQIMGPTKNMSTKERELYMELRRLRAERSGREDVRKHLKD